MARLTGNRPQLTPAVHDAIVKAVEQGLSPSRAGVLLGFNESTVNQWIERGEDRRPGYISHPRYINFAKAIRKAWVADERRRLDRLEQAGKGGAILHEKIITTPDGTEIREVKRAAPQWQADAWWLERTRRDDYALRTRTDITLDVAPHLLALHQQWQQARELATAQPPALPTPTIDAEFTPLPSPPTTDAQRQHTFTLLDRLNRRGEPDGT